MAAGPILQVHLPKPVARALDDQFAALVTKGALRLITRQVADVDVFQARFQGDLPGLFQRAHRGGVVVLHFIQGVETGEVHRRQGAQFVFDPGAHLGQGLGLVVVLGNDQVDDLQKDPLLPQGLQSPEHRGQFAPHQVPVELGVEGFQVDAGRVQDFGKFLQRLGVDVARGMAGVQQTRLFR